jgi:5-methylcytosine-specific restriction endonuclease McrA
MVRPKVTVLAQKKKAPIPKALREQVWILNVGKQFEQKCLVKWCQNRMNVFDFHVGHNIPESQGGSTSIANLKPICARCNLSMGSQYSIEEWSKMGQEQPQKNHKKIAPVPKKPWWLLCC